MSADPVVTVLMPMFNARLYLRAAVESILVQTFRDFEFLVIDDASTDGGGDELAGFGDSRIWLLRNHENLGVAASLNRGLSLARGKYIARMDADDISMPRRLEHQVAFMDAHPEVGISGGWIQLFGGRELPHTARVPTDHQEIAAYMVFENPMCHMTVMMRRNFLDHFDLRYDPVFSRSEDYELWTRAITCFPMANLGEVFVRVRRHGGSVTRENWGQVTDQTETILARMVKEIGVVATAEEIHWHHRVGRGYRMTSRHEVDRAEQWLLRLTDVNKEGCVHDLKAFHRVAARIWFRACANSTPLGLWVVKKWRSSPLSSGYKPLAGEWVMLVLSLCWHGLRRKGRSGS